MIENDTLKDNLGKLFNNCILFFPINIRMKVKSYKFASVIVLLLVITFYVYYLVSGSWAAVELSVLDTVISIIVAFVVNIAAVIIGLDIALQNNSDSPDKIHTADYASKIHSI